MAISGLPFPQQQQQQGQQAQQGQPQNQTPQLPPVFQPGVNENLFFPAPVSFSPPLVSGNFNQQPTGQPTGPQPWNPQPGRLQPGSPHPYTLENMVNIPLSGLAPPPPLPGTDFTDRFLPPILRDPFVSQLNAASQLGGFAAQAAPQAGAFQQGLYSPGLNLMEATQLGSAGALGLRGLESAFNQINAQYENTPFASTRFRQMTDAGNQFAQQMANIGSQMGLQRQQMAAQNLPFAFGFPLQAGQAGQAAASSLLNLAGQGMTGELNFPLAAYSGFPVVSPAIVQGAGGGGGKK